MPNIDFKRTWKIVYAGPPLAGKTSSLQRIFEAYRYGRDPSEVEVAMRSAATETDRTLIMDVFLKKQSWKLTITAAPGAVFYNEHHYRILQDVDAAVFVVDSQEERHGCNADRLWQFERNLIRNALLSGGKDPILVPVVLQFNKRDLPGVLPVSSLTATYRFRGEPCFESSAPFLKDHGVFDAFNAVLAAIDTADAPRPTIEDPASTLFDSDAEVWKRAAALYDLTQSENPEVEEMLLCALDDPHRLIRTRALYSLAKRTGIDSAEIYRRSYDDDAEVRRIALICLTYLALQGVDQEECLDRLTEALTDPVVSKFGSEFPKALISRLGADRRTAEISRQAVTAALKHS